MKRYSVELTADEIRLIRSGLNTYQWYLDEYRNGIKPEVSDKCDELSDRFLVMLCEIRIGEEDE